MNNLPTIVELVGPAGAGKTTLLRALQTAFPVQIGMPHQRLAYLPHLIRNGALLLPAYLLQQRQSSRWFTWRESRSMAYLHGWHDQLCNFQDHDSAAIVWDHGPIYRLTLLSTFGPELRQSARFQKWWDATRTLWGKTLNVIIWLDAPNEVLIERIRNRPINHTLKHSDHAIASDYLNRYRTAYGNLINYMSNQYGVQQMRFDTSCTATADMVAQISAIIDPS